MDFRLHGITVFIVRVLAVLSGGEFGSMPSFGALETIPPLAIITAAVCVIGSLQGLVQQGVYGKPKAIGVDPWDRKIEERDARLKAQ